MKLILEDIDPALLQELADAVTRQERAKEKREAAFPQVAHRMAAMAASEYTLCKGGTPESFTCETDAGFLWWHGARCEACLSAVRDRYNPKPIRK